MNKTSRFIGIDLCRGLAAFAVILVHSGDETWGIPISDRAIQFRYLFYFAVPFFLAASFYFSTKRLPLNISISFWQKKFRRIVIPYLLWSLFYMISKTVIFLLTHNNSQIQQLLSDPVAITFLGAASYHLYFLPLLVSGTLLLPLANYFNHQQKSLTLLSLLSVSSLIVYHLLLTSNNSFDLGTYTAFANILNLISTSSWFYSVFRIILVNLAWIIRCLPYFFIAMLINQLFKKYNYQLFYRQPVVMLLFFGFLYVNIIGNNFLSKAVSEIAIAFLLLLFGISISCLIKDNTLITSLGLCSFGIYLIHPFIKSAVEIIIIKFLPQLAQSVSIMSMLVYSLSTFLISWLLIAILLRNKALAQYI
jgi:peptidoglycan/LPS O-acetylase OafA/YrhL